jgi:hypothetical protein
MEILKFSEPPKRSSRTSTRKKSGVMPLLSVVAAVAIVGGMSSTLAGTITLNSGNNVEFGQGVVTAAACDTTVKVLPTASYDTSSVGSFKVSEIKIADLGLNAGVSDGNSGCKNKRLVIRAYALNSNTPLPWNGVVGGSAAITLDLPDTETLTATDIGRGSQALTVATAVNYDNANTARTDDVGQSFNITGLAISSTVVRFTIESSDK